MDPTVDLLARVEAFIAEQNIGAARFGWDAVRDPNFVYQLRQGREPRRRTVQKVLAAMDRVSQPAEAAQ